MSLSRKPTDAEVTRSIHADHLISFIDGKPYVMLRAHLRSCGLSARAYFKRYGLPKDYPLVAQAYSQRRSEASRRSAKTAKRRALAQVEHGTSS